MELSGHLHSVCFFCRAFGSFPEHAAEVSECAARKKLNTASTQCSWANAEPQQRFSIQVACFDMHSQGSLRIFGAV